MKRGDGAKKIEGYAERLRDGVRRAGFLRSLLGHFAVVWALIARIPLPKGWWPKVMPKEADALALMPLAGGLLGLIAVSPAWLLAHAVPPAACAWIACGIYTAAGWSFHLDGWGDLWDGIGSGKRGEAMRAVMKDSRSGSFGVAGIVLAIAIRASLLSAIAPERWLAVCALAGGVGRYASTAGACAGAYPWEVGLGRDFIGGFKGYQLFCASLAVCCLLPLSPLAWAAGTALSGLTGLAFALWANRTLGGTNGDVLGAAAVVGELLTMIVCAV